MDLTRLAVDAGQFINRAVQVKSFASLRSECVMLAPCAHKCAVNGVKLLFCFSTRERTSARRTGRSWSPGWRSCWPWQTPPRPARTRSCPRRRSYCSPTPVRAGPILSYFTKLDFYHCCLKSLGPCFLLIDVNLNILSSKFYVNLFSKVLCQGNYISFKDFAACLD